MDELHASWTVAFRVRDRRRELGLSMRELAERSGLSEDVIEAIVNGRRRRGVTVDELMVLANALETPAMVLLPRDYDYFSDELKQRVDEAERRRKGQPSELRQALSSLAELPKILGEMAAELEKVPDGAVLAIERDGRLIPIERDGKLLPVEELTSLVSRGLGLGDANTPLDHRDARPPSANPDQP